MRRSARTWWLFRIVKPDSTAFTHPNNRLLPNGPTQSTVTATNSLEPPTNTETRVAAEVVAKTAPEATMNQPFGPDSPAAKAQARRGRAAAFP